MDYHLKRDIKLTNPLYYALRYRFYSDRLFKHFFKLGFEQALDIDIQL